MRVNLVPTLTIAGMAIAAAIILLSVLSNADKKEPWELEGYQDMVDDFEAIRVFTIAVNADGLIDAREVQAMCGNAPQWIADVAYARRWYEEYKNDSDAWDRFQRELIDYETALETLRRGCLMGG